MHRNQWHDRNSWVIKYSRVTMFGTEQEIRIQHLYDVFDKLTVLQPSPSDSTRRKVSSPYAFGHLCNRMGILWTSIPQKEHWLRWLLFFSFLPAVPNLYSAVIQVKQRAACRVQVCTKNVFFKSDWKLICVFNFCTTLCARQFFFFLFFSAAVRSSHFNFSQFPTIKKF